MSCGLKVSTATSVNNSRYIFEKLLIRHYLTVLNSKVELLEINQVKKKLPVIKVYPCENPQGQEVNNVEKRAIPINAQILYQLHVFFISMTFISIYRLRFGDFLSIC